MSTLKANHLSSELGPTQLIAVSSIKFPKSYRAYSSATIRKAARFIEAFGLRVPILVDTERNVVAGEIWALAHRHLGLPEIAALFVEGLSPDQLKAYRLGHDRIPELAEWDTNTLGELFHDWTSRDIGFDLELSGFEIPEIDNFIIKAKAGASASSDDTLATADAGPPVTAPLDLWRCGDHRIFCGSALDSDPFRQVMGQDRASAVITDPPYNVKIDGHAGGKGSIHHSEFAMASGEMDHEEFTEFLARFMKNASAYSQQGSLHYIYMDWRHTSETLQAGSRAYSELKNIAVWVKSNGGMGSFYRSQHELIFIYKLGDAPHRNNVQLGKYGRNRSNVWQYAGANGFDGRKTDEGHLLALHPTVKPVQMLADIMLDCTAPDDIILDPFLGSGSSLIAAERVGRQLRAIELNPAYVDVAIRRWQRHTGASAVNEITGRIFDS